MKKVLAHCSRRFQSLPESLVGKAGQFRDELQCSRTKKGSPSYHYDWFHMPNQNLLRLKSQCSMPTSSTAQPGGETTSGICLRKREGISRIRSCVELNDFVDDGSKDTKTLAQERLSNRATAVLASLLNQS